MFQENLTSTHTSGFSQHLTFCLSVCVRACAVWSKTRLKEQSWNSWWWVPGWFLSLIWLHHCYFTGDYHQLADANNRVRSWQPGFGFSSRTTRSSNDQRWKKWILPAGCAKRWAWTSQAPPPAALSDEAPTALSYTALNTSTSHHKHWHFFILVLSLKQNKQFGLPLQLFAHQQQGPFSRYTVRPQLQHAGVE